MIDVRAALGVLNDWYDKYRYLAKKSKAQHDELARVCDALDVIEAALDAQEAELKELRAENERLKKAAATHGAPPPKTKLSEAEKEWLRAESIWAARDRWANLY
ncbi:MAG: hypothetical protein IPP15_15985 [Saprospiraceae bacterium]|uniref:Uncharacterized protein n=1 Tax=Candidatus Opimibacter skivensis TaxID=2982028 RepID=A0A9D7SXP2_9BACT|nr:hypothetical protein [Candidatus Opimibacter skivensis]